MTGLVANPGLPFSRRELAQYVAALQAFTVAQGNQPLDLRGVLEGLSERLAANGISEDLCTGFAAQLAPHVAEHEGDLRQLYGRLAHACSPVSAGEAYALSRQIEDTILPAITRGEPGVIDEPNAIDVESREVVPAPNRNFSESEFRNSPSREVRAGEQDFREREGPRGQGNFREPAFLGGKEREVPREQRDVSKPGFDAGQQSRNADFTPYVPNRELSADWVKDPEGNWHQVSRGGA
jgi:hypothetical protein